MGGLTDVIESEILPVVSKVAPLLGSVLGSPLSGLVVSLLARSFNVDATKVNDLAAAIKNDPETELKLKQLENEHHEALEKILAQNYATEVDDRKDARKNAVLYKDFLRHMAYVVTCGFFGALLLLFAPIDINNNARELLSMLIGMLASKWQTIIDFFYGSSHARNKLKKSL